MKLTKLVLIIAIVFNGMLFIAGCAKDEVEVPIHHNQRYIKFAYTLNIDKTIDTAFIQGDSVIPNNLPHQFTSSSKTYYKLNLIWLNIETNKMYYIEDSTSTSKWTYADYYVERWK